MAILKQISIFLVIIGIVLGTMSCAQDVQEVEQEVAEMPIVKAKASNLLSVATLNDWLKNSEAVKLIEVSKEANYTKSHLPNARNVWRPDYENKADYPYEGMRASQLQIAELIGELGVNRGDSLVLYDDRGGCDAVRFAWILELYGKSDVFILDGGKRAWQMADLALTNVIPAHKPSTFTFEGLINEQEVATWEEVNSAIQDTNVLIVDTREPYEYKGQPFLKKGEKHNFKKGAYAYGCIPTALHYNWSDAVELKTNHCFKSVNDLEYDLAKAGVNKDKEIIVYCQSGVRSAHTAYVLKEVLGYPNVKNYDGSWIEWSYNYTTNQSVNIEKHTTDAEHERLYNQLASSDL